MRSFVAVSQNIALQMKQRKTAVSCPSNDGILKVSYEDLLIATDGFSSANLIGTSSFGSVFRGVRALLDQTPIAVKVNNLDRHGASKSFIAECVLVGKGEPGPLAVNVSGPNVMDITDLEEFPATLLFHGRFNSLKDWQKRQHEWLKRSRKEADFSRAVRLPEGLAKAVP
ncbi:hypothetical protein CDL15_Pgr004293 [Punica granatum]|uniref:Uncharacterized protein n=1 Tax=Punica granatum TaxID=22663 RepID=A0A218XHP1_PUNGR|nr:hypothetical protein CDL15_Pgr004293 [Punica granatum]